MSYLKERREAFEKAFLSEKAKEYISVGEKIKALDKKNDRQMLVIKLVSLISLLVIGYLAFGKFGAIIFAIIAIFSSFFLHLTSKKNLMLQYFTFYRTRVPELIAISEETSVEKAEPILEPASLPFDDCDLSYRVSHKYDDIYISFAKLQKNGETFREGVLYTFKAKVEREAQLKEILDKIIPSETVSEYVLKASDGITTLFLVGAEDYLDGRLEATDDLTLPSLTHQLEFYLFGKAVFEFLNNENSLFAIDVTKE